MKNLVLALLLTTPYSAFAVTTAYCPRGLGIRVSQVSITKNLPTILRELASPSFPEQNAAVQQSISNLANQPFIQGIFPLVQAKDGRCLYQTPNLAGGKIELYTERGVNTLYLQVPIGPRGILLRSYMHFDLQPGRVVLAATPAGIALAIPRYDYTDYSAGGPLIFIGQSFKTESR